MTSFKKKNKNKIVMISYLFLTNKLDYILQTHKPCQYMREPRSPGNKLEKGKKKRKEKTIH